MTKKKSLPAVRKVARAVRDETFTVKNARVLAPFDNHQNRMQLVWHTFHKTDSGILHRTDDIDRAAVTLENWPDYVKGNDAAALACGYSNPELPPALTYGYSDLKLLPTP